MADTPFIGQLMAVPYNFAPRGWAQCDGQLLSIAQNTALFSLLGTNYGGNGQTTFGLPDLRGRLPMHYGQGPGLSNHTLGEISGTENVTLLTTQIPAHNHAINMNNDTASISATGSGAFLNSKTESGESIVSSGNASPVVANPLSTGNTGGSQPHTNMQPVTVINWIIALEGIFPSRN